MTKVKLIVIMGFLLAFGAGLVVGIVGSRRWIASAGATQTDTVPTQPTTRRAGLTQMLKLTPEQAEKWRMVVDPASKEMRHQHEERRNAIRKTRDDAILALLSVPHQAEFQRIMSDYNAASAQLERERPRDFEKMREQLRPQIRQILNDEQWNRYEEFFKRMREDHRRREASRRGDEKATTRPALTEPSH